MPLLCVGCVLQPPINEHNDDDDDDGQRCQCVLGAVKTCTRFRRAETIAVCIGAAQWREQ